MGTMGDWVIDGKREPEDAAREPGCRLSEPSFDERVDAVLAEIGYLLKAKNALYGNSALNPVRMFSKADPVEQLLVRIDDKLSRLARGSAAGEDTEKDLLGYLVLLRIARGECGPSMPGSEDPWALPEGWAWNVIVGGKRHASGPVLATTTICLTDRPDDTQRHLAPKVHDLVMRRNREDPLYG